MTGFDVLDQWQFPEVPFVLGDLDEDLPFDDAAFDAVLLCEALGYLENPSRLLREFSRVVRPGGALVITMPNVFSLQSRLRFMLNGTYRWFPHAQYRGETKHELADTYRDPMRVTTLCFHMERMGFKVEKVRFGGKRALTALMPLGWLLQGTTLLHNAARRGKKQTPPEVNSTAALLHTNVGVLARKPK